MLLHPSVIERFAVSAPGLSGSARRTLRTNLRFLAREVVPALAPADAPLPRERAKAPYSPAEIAGYLALADAQPALSRRMRATGLVCLGACAGVAARPGRPPMSSAGPAGPSTSAAPGRGRCRCWAATMTVCGRGVAAASPHHPQNNHAATFAFPGCPG